MSLNDTPSGERVWIGFFGLRNAGKSTLVNAITGQDLAVVSDVPGTTTDPVRKAMELLPIGPVMIIDTPGVDDDQGDLGAERVRRARIELARCDVAVLVYDAIRGRTAADEALEAEVKARGVPYLVVPTKLEPTDATAVKNRIAELAKGGAPEKFLVRDLLKPGDYVVLVTPIDSAAPKGRMILPQQQMIRDVLDAGCAMTVCRETELEDALKRLGKPPRMVITDSQAFGFVSKIVPPEIPLTSFSILMARYKGDIVELVKGARELASLKDGDRVLISEGCTHHRQCGDIGTCKMPKWIEGFCNAKPLFEFTSGGDFPDDPGKYRLIVHCGGCMLHQREMERRLAAAKAAGVPIVNYGVAIAEMHGILTRSLSPLGIV